MLKCYNRKAFLAFLIKEMVEKGVAVEIGVLHGDFSKMILELLKPSKLILVDPYVRSDESYGASLSFLNSAYSNEEDYNNIVKRFEKEIYSCQVEIVRKYSYEAVDYVAVNSCDFIYHDASHLYDDIKRDLNDWLPKLKEGGLVCGHDYIEFDNFGVIQAVDEFCKEHGFEMIIFNENGGDYALKKINKAKEVIDYAYGKQDISKYKKALEDNK